MTTTFWVMAGLLIALALAFIAYPLFFNRARQRAESDIRNQNLMAYRTRMAELDAEFAAGVIDEENFRQLKEELAGSMLDDVGDPDEAPAAAAVSQRRGAPALVVLASVVAVPVAAVMLYQQWGALDDVEQFQAMQAMVAADGDRAAQMLALTAQLRAQLEASPDNPDGWAMLARSYMRLEKYPEAARAFERLAGVVDEDGSRAVAWGLSAQAWFFASQGAMDEQVTRAITRARALNPDEVNALGLLGINAFSRQAFEEAIGHWERIVEVAPDHPQLPAIREGIAQAYQRLGREAPMPESGPAVAGQTVSPQGVSVRVELADAFREEVPADTTLFIFARKPGDRSGPPVAVARLTAADLPADIRLDDSHAMAPTARISEAGEVLVTARLSPSGSAMPQAGDWQGGLDNPLPVTAEAGQPVVLVIDQQLHN
ncbi:c-type cytochrome biogenesis protein CcmI [Marinobacter sp.]|uniref:c-type cytochrome biogenesis protein CcmI n=1 Tax=Marinobacter sp. TaxID=50741 RepID=UPI0019BF6829|nr:c-type cytochrome biogenesis protein CcmI [Marinobacter sp.]MBD3656470.1 c-type cytochrome biogenesis protein CcmI [Marinobacter sp.]